MLNLTEAITDLRTALTEKAETVGSELSWGDGDRSAPKTPWGPAQQGYVLAKDVIWYSTASHGGMRVPGTVANKMLSDAAKRQAMQWGGAYWYEEDVAANIPFYEVEAWRKSASKWFKGLGSATDGDLRKDIERWFPEYLKLKADGYTLPALPQVGEVWQFNVPLSFGSGYSFEKGDQIKVGKITSAGIMFTSDKYPSVGYFRLTKNLASKGTVWSKIG